tara:strand:+ start:4132 stop:5724 length:1593 start_codon:yes stop_codon:yes gene_type:complete
MKKNIKNIVLISFSIIATISLLIYNISGKKSIDTIPKIAIAGLGIESSTFSPAVTNEEAFHAKIGNEIFERYPFLSVVSNNRKRANWFPTLVGKSLPGGIVTKEAYESLLNQTLNLLKKNLPYDGLFLDLHGAMSVQGLNDAEGDYIKRIRDVIGYETIISTSMDLHGNVSEKLAEESDLITCYRMAPHEDAMESKQRALENLLTRIENGKGKPLFKAWIPVPILLPGEQTSTRINPGKKLYSQVEPASKIKGVLDAAIWIGYAWADESRNHAAIVVTGDDENNVKLSAEKLANSFWQYRNEFNFVAPTTTLKKSLKQAINSSKTPFFISDMGDNPTAGGAGDVTWTLKKLLERVEFKSIDGPSLIYASIPGPELIVEALKIGEGKEIEAYVGAQVDNRYSPPILLKGIINKIKQGDIYAETEVVVQVGSINVIVTNKRKPYHKEKDFSDLNLNLRETDIVVVKIGYLVPELYEIQKDWVMALTPGGVDQDLKRLGYENIKRPMFPLDKKMKDPDLKARLIPVSGSSKKL